MNAPRSLLFLPLVLLLAFSARWEPARVLQLAPDERDLGASRWLIDDPETCEHLRRIELGIAGDRVPQFDAFVNHPAGGEIPALPVFDTVVAGLAQRFLGSQHGEPALGGVDEADVEDFAARFSPLLGVLATLAVYFAARTLLRDSTRRDGLALCAALVFALHPAAVHASSAGRLDSMSLAALLLALLVRSTTRALSSTERPAIVLDALIAGVIAGALAATTAAGIFLFLPAWLGFLWLAWRGPEERRADSVRGGLLFCIVSYFVSNLTQLQGPWEARPGAIVAAFSSGVSTLLFFSTAPFIVAMLVKKNEKPRVFQLACLLTALVVMAWYVPQLWRDLEPALAWWFGNRSEIATVMPGMEPGVLGMHRTPFDAHALSQRFEGIPRSFFQLDLLVSAIAFVPAWSFLAHRRVSTERAALLIFGVVTFGLSCAFQGTAPLFVVALACTIAIALDLALDVLPAKKIVLVAAGLFIALLFVRSLAPRIASPDLARREERIAFVAGLRWMRTNTPAGSAWNSPRMTSNWGVLSSVADGPLVEYHARRPAVTSPNAALSGLSGVRAASEALENFDAPKLARFMRGKSAKYVVVGTELGHHRRELQFESGIFTGVLGDMSAMSTYELLAYTADGPVDGFDRVYASKRRVTLNGHAPKDDEPSGPAISIYKLPESATQPTREVEMRAK